MSFGKRLSDAQKQANLSQKKVADQLIYGDSDQMAKEKIQDGELLNMFSKVQNLASDEVHWVKSLLNAYLIKSELHQKFIVK